MSIASVVKAVLTPKPRSEVLQSTIDQAELDDRKNVRRPKLRADYIAALALARETDDATRCSAEKLAFDQNEEAIADLDGPDGLVAFNLKREQIAADLARTEQDQKDADALAASREALYASGNTDLAGISREMRKLLPAAQVAGEVFAATYPLIEQFVAKLPGDAIDQDYFPAMCRSALRDMFLDELARHGLLPDREPTGTFEKALKGWIGEKRQLARDVIIDRTHELPPEPAVIVSVPAPPAEPVAWAPRHKTEHDRQDYVQTYGDRDAAGNRMTAAGIDDAIDLQEARNERAYGPGPISTGAFAQAAADQRRAGLAFDKAAYSTEELIALGAAGIGPTPAPPPEPEPALMSISEYRIAYAVDARSMSNVEIATDIVSRRLAAPAELAAEKQPEPARLVDDDEHTDAAAAPIEDGPTTFSIDDGALHADAAAATSETPLTEEVEP